MRVICHEGIGNCRMIFYKGIGQKQMESNQLWTLAFGAKEPSCRHRWRYLSDTDSQLYGGARRGGVGARQTRVEGIR